jgi:CheY-like chemotaxis protein
MRLAGHLSKPIKQSELFDVIATAFGGLNKSAEPPVATVTPSTSCPSRRLRVLLAEDNPVNQRLVVKLMEKHGHTLVVANNGVEALAALDRGKFDVLLMDAQMPEMSGFEATARIREREKSTGEHIPIIAMTAHALKGDRERCLDAGMDAYVSKPIQASALFEAIESVALTPAVVARFEEKLPADEVTPSAKAFDLDGAMAMLDGDTELFNELVGLFMTESASLLDQIQQSIARRDAKVLERSAHSLKGSVAAFCAESARDVAQTLESIGSRGDFDQAGPVADELQKEITRLTSALAEYQKEAVLCES